MLRASCVTMLLALFGSACGTAKVYRLPLEAGRAPETFAPIAAVAGQLGMQAVEHPQSVHVQYDDVSWIQFMVQNDQYNMVIVIDEKQVPQGELSKRFAEAKLKGDEIWEKALAQLGEGTSGGSADVNITVNVDTGEGELTGDCNKLFQCYAKLSTDLCESSDAGCTASFEFKVEGNDETACREALLAVPTVVQPLAIAKPGYATPEICQ